MEHIFRVADFLLPSEETDMRAWASIAGDQYTADDTYWQRTQELTKDKPSTLHITLTQSDAGMEDKTLDDRIAIIHKDMEEYAQNVLTRSVHGFIYVERQTRNGLRQGIVGVIDLETYSAEKSAQLMIRPSEQTNPERIRQLVKLREGAKLETGTALLMVNDLSCVLTERFASRKERLRKVYDTDLMQGAGHVTGWAITEASDIAEVENIVDLLGSRTAFDARYPEAQGAMPFSLLVGDGDHTVTAAKAYWDALKPTLLPAQQVNHHARFCLAEVVNVNCPAMVINAFQRLVRGMNVDTFMKELHVWLQEIEAGECDAADATQSFVVTSGHIDATVYLSNPPHRLAVGTVEAFLQTLAEKYPHMTVESPLRERAVREAAEADDVVGIVLPQIDKRALFHSVVQHGALPNHTFSIGGAADKRFNLECRIIEGEKSDDKEENEGEEIDGNNG